MGRGTLRATPSVLGDRDQLLHGRVELLLARAPEPFTQDRDDLALRAAVHEHDETKAEPLLVLGVESFELRQGFGIVVASLLCRRALGQIPRADRWMCIERFEL